MSNPLLGTVLVPVASERDAVATCRAISRRVGGESPTLHVVNVIEKAGGAPDKASVEQRVERAERIFAVVEAELADATVTVETEIVYGTDVAAAILDAARRLDATSIAFTPRGDSRWLQLLTGSVARKLVSGTDRPLLVLPREGADD